MFSEFAFTYRKGNTFYKEIHGKWYHKNNFYMLNDFHYNSPLRGVSNGLCEHLRALASMRAVRLFLRARAVIKYVLLAASILKNSCGEQRALRYFSGQNMKKRFAPSNLADTVLSIPAVYSQLCLVGDDVRLRLVSSSVLQCDTPGA